jgi:hypothetical protein
MGFGVTVSESVGEVLADFICSSMAEQEEISIVSAKIALTSIISLIGKHFSLVSMEESNVVQKKLATRSWFI